MTLYLTHAVILLLSWHPWSLRVHNGPYDPMANLWLQECRILRLRVFQDAARTPQVPKYWRPQDPRVLILGQIFFVLLGIPEHLNRSKTHPWASCRPMANRLAQNCLEYIAISRVLMASLRFIMEPPEGILWAACLGSKAILNFPTVYWRSPCVLEN